jgi:hypothetical protein
MSSRSKFVARLVAAAIIGVSYPYVELAWKCRANSANSEACIWGRAYMPLSRWAEPLIIIPIAFLLLTVVGLLLNRAQGRRIDV